MNASATQIQNAVSAHPPVQPTPPPAPMPQGQSGQDQGGLMGGFSPAVSASAGTVTPDGGFNNNNGNGGGNNSSGQQSIQDLPQNMADRRYISEAGTVTPDGGFNNNNGNGGGNNSSGQQSIQDLPQNMADRRYISDIEDTKPVMNGQEQTTNTDTDIDDIDSDSDTGEAKAAAQQELDKLLKEKNLTQEDLDAAKAKADKNDVPFKDVLRNDFNFTEDEVERTLRFMEATGQIPPGSTANYKAGGGVPDEAKAAVGNAGCGPGCGCSGCSGSGAAGAGAGAGASTNGTEATNGSGGSGSSATAGKGAEGSGGGGHNCGDGSSGGAEGAGGSDQAGGAGNTNGPGNAAGEGGHANPSTGETDSFKLGDTEITIEGGTPEEIADLKDSLQQMYDKDPKFKDMIDNESEGLNFTIGDLPGNTAGLADVGGKQISIDPEYLDSGQSPEIIAHEVAHAAGYNHGAELDNIAKRAGDTVTG